MLRLALAGYRAVLRLYPPRFRAEFEQELLDIFAARAQSIAPAASRLALSGLLARATLDVCRHACAERWRSITSRRPGLSLTDRRVRPARRQSSSLSARLPMPSLFQDARGALRVLRRSPGHAAVCVATIAVGIAASTTIFAGVHGVVLRPLPFPDSERVVSLCETNEKVQGFCVASAVNVEDWARQSRTLDAAGVARSESVELQLAEGRLGVRGGIATPGFFRTLSLRAAFGRLFEDGDLNRGANDVVIVSHAFWASHLGGDPSAIGTTLSIEHRPMRVIGVLPAGAFVPDLAGVDIWKPLTASIDDVTVRRWRGFIAIGRVRPGVSLAAARQDLDAIRARLTAAYPADNAGWGVRLARLRDDIAGPAAPTMWAFLAASAVLWLIAFANVASLTLMRNAGREREFALRMSLGAGRLRLASQLLVESGVLAILGAVAGLALTALLVPALLARAPAGVPRLSEIAIDGGTIAVALAAALAGAAVLAVVALRHVPRELRVDATGARATGARVAKSRVLVTVVQTALAFVLLTGAGLLARGLLRMMQWDAGFDRGNLSAAWLVAPPGTFASPKDAVPALQRARDAAAAIPGVAHAGLGSAGPLFGGLEPGAFTRADTPAVDPITVHWYDVDASYFRTIGRSLVRGREFTIDDRAGAPMVAIVNETLARRAFSGENPIGHVVDVDRHRSVIVGVVTDVHPARPDAPVESEVFWPIDQYPRYGAYLIVRAAGPGPVDAAIRRAIVKAAPDVQIGTTRSVDAMFDATLVTPRFAALLVGGFAVCAVMLAVVGLASVVGFGIVLRTREFGVRAALGATPAGLMRAVVGRSLAYVAVGMAGGLAIALAAGRFAAGLLFGVRPHDPLTLVVVASVFAALGVLATVVAARRILALDPLRALRAE